MKVSELGEFGLVELIADVLGVDAGENGRGVLLDIGDDAAAWQPRSDVELVTTDTMIENVHFRPETTSHLDLGWKALAINLSDIAAMGGAPRYALVSLGLSPETDAESVADLYRGMKEIGDRFGCRVIGGDTVGSPCTMINITLIGEASRPGRFLRRDAARPGDLIAVTGWLGSSGAGFRVLNGDVSATPDVRARLAEAHNRPVPRVQEGQSLLNAGVLTAMDLSDGLMSDLPKICKMSGVGARVNVSALPISPDLREVFGPQATALALSAGEDYELLVTGTRDVLDRASAQVSIPLTVIGDVVEGEGVTLLDDNGDPVPAPDSGWEHFSTS